MSALDPKSAPNAPAAGRAEWTPRAEMSVLNTDIPRLDGPQKATGRARYTHDVRLPGMVYARLVVTPFARADVGRISLTAARKVPGVVYAEVVKQDDEGVKYQGYDGILAVIAAETPEAAEDGVRAVRAKVEPLRPPLVTAEQALADGAPAITRRGNVSGESSRGDARQARCGSRSRSRREPWRTSWRGRRACWTLRVAGAQSRKPSSQELRRSASAVDSASCAISAGDRLGACRGASEPSCARAWLSASCAAWLPISINSRARQNS